MAESRVDASGNAQNSQHHGKYFPVTRTPASSYDLKRICSMR